MVEVQEALLFDWDGVILDSSNEENVQKVLNVLPACNINIENNVQTFRTRIKSLWHLPARQLFEGLGLSTKDCEHACQELLRVDENFSYRLIPHAHNTLKWLSYNKFKLGIVSNRNRVSLTRLLKNFDMEYLFDYVSCGDDHPWAKPDTRAFDDILNHFQIESNIRVNDCRYFGDSPSDIICGNSRGVETVAVLSGIHSRKELMDAGAKRYKIIPSIAYAPKWLTKRGY